MTIRELRESTGMTQTEFGNYLNIPMRTIQNWENGKRQPPEYVVELINYKLENEGRGIVFRTYEIIYEDETGIEIIGEYTTNSSNGHGTDEALQIAGVDMDEYAKEHRWDGWDWNCLKQRLKKNS